MYLDRLATLVDCYKLFNCVLGETKSPTDLEMAERGEGNRAPSRTLGDYAYQ